MSGAVGILFLLIGVAGLLVALQGIRHAKRGGLTLDVFREGPLGTRILLLACGLLGLIGGVLLAIEVVENRG